MSSATYDAADELKTWNGGTTFQYDANGNLTYDGSNTYQWNARNQLDQMPPYVLFAYDAFGRRIKKTVGASTTQFLYDGLNPVQELSATNAVTANLLTGLGIDEFFTRTATGSTRRSFLPDALGSTVALSDDNETLQTQYTYEPFGKESLVSGSPSDSNPYQFTGRENDGTGLYYYRARYYSPTWGRFITEDPIGFIGGFNRYGYVNNSPLVFTDPLGRQAIGGVINAPPNIGGQPAVGPSGLPPPSSSESCPTPCEEAARDAFNLCEYGGGGTVATGAGAAVAACALAGPKMRLCMQIIDVPVAVVPEVTLFFGCRQQYNDALRRCHAGSG